MENICALLSFVFVLSPVPSYNWTRRGANLPRQAVLASYNRVLLIPNVQVEDQGEYVCRATNDRASIENSVILSIQGRPSVFLFVNSFNFLVVEWYNSVGPHHVVFNLSVGTILTKKYLKNFLLKASFK